MLDVWKSPEERERVTQLNLAERFEEVQRQGEWMEIRCSEQDDYPGWLHFDRKALIAWVEEWLKIPYLWGGMSRAGIDCSGLVHLAYRRQGWKIARDAKDQFAQGKPVEKLLPGDLLFTPKLDHVVIYAGGDDLLESASSQGGVVKSKIGDRKLIGRCLLC